MKEGIDLFTVRTAEEKLRLLCSLVEEVFHSGKRLLICVDSRQAADYVDALLWRSPPTSFLPHQISDVPCEEHIAITEGTANINQAEVVINLGSSACPLARSGVRLIEFEDLTSEGRSAISCAKCKAYVEQGIAVKRLAAV